MGWDMDGTTLGNINEQSCNDAHVKTLFPGVNKLTLPHAFNV